MANVPSASDISSTHLGLQKQAVQYSEKVVADKTAAQAKLDAEYSAASDKVASARTAYFDAQNNPNISESKLQELKSNYSAAKDERATIGERAESNQASLEKAESGLDANKVALSSAQNAADSGSTSVTSSTPVMNDASATQAENIGSNNTVPAGERVTTAPADVQPMGAGAPDTALLKNAPEAVSTTDTQPQPSNEKPPVSESTAVPVEESLGPKEEVVQPEKKIDPDADPFEAARLKAAAEESPSPTEQAVIDAKQDTKLSQEEEGQQREFEASQRAKLKAETDKAGNPEGNWTASSVNQVRAAKTVAVARNTIKNEDWRIRLSLAPGTTYLYNQAGPGDILYPLKSTDGIIFPYSPTIQTAYRANYDATEVTHSNYKMYFYKNSNVDEITLTADFTAQDNAEAEYMLAVIHFLRSVTKMFYGQDGNNGPRAGTPPPLCYLNGYGQYQFNEHPVLISNFSYTLPNDVDYIRAGSVTVAPGTNKDSYQKKEGPVTSAGGKNLMTKIRTAASGLAGGLLGSLKKAAAGGKTKGAMSADPKWKDYANKEATYVPTKLQITLTLLPIVTRNDISKNFSLEKYAKGDLLKGRSRPSGGGIW